MLERIVLAAIVTCCIHLFLNLDGKSSTIPSLETRIGAMPEVIDPVTFFG